MSSERRNKRTYFSVNNINEIALKYVDLKSSAVRLFRKMNIMPEDGQVEPKHVAVDCDFNVILN
jgi:hypothetical protein